MAICCQLAEPASYRAFDWDVRQDAEDAEYWLGLFESFPDHIERWLLEDGLAGHDFERQWRAFRNEYAAGMARFRNDPAVEGGLSTLRLGAFRQAVLNKYGWPDPYACVKRRENALAAGLYPQVVREVDGLASADRWETLLRGVFAGNMFDLGSPRTIALYDGGHLDYHAMLEQIPKRPWFIDDADAIIARLNATVTAPLSDQLNAANPQQPLSQAQPWEIGNRRRGQPEVGRRSEIRPWRQALFFVDNAGTDIVLGVLPLAREMARSGIRVVLAANSTPALNDITLDELNPLLKQLASRDSILAALMADACIVTIANGSGSPLIDLADISDECNRAAAASDLIVLEGMGRGVESNWRQRFLCDAWRLALVKDEVVAKWVGCPLFSPVCRFDPAGA